MKANKIVLGSANFGNTYRGIILSEKDCFDILEEFEKRGGELVDTAMDYGNSLEIIQKYIITKNSKLKILLKIDKYYFESIIDYNNIHAIISRDNNIQQTKYLNGQSMYYPHELNPNAKIVIIPDSILFLDYAPIIKLHAKLYVRSIFNMSGIRLSHSQHVDLIDGYVIGVENKKQLIENMETYNV